MRYYTFVQYCSGGGSFEGPAYIIVAAHSVAQANLRAQDVGVYFDGCGSGLDCACCGDRWDRVDECDGRIYKHIYGAPIKEFDQPAGSDRKHYAVYCYNGSYKIYCLNTHILIKREKI